MFVDLHVLQVNANCHCIGLPWIFSKTCFFVDSSNISGDVFEIIVCNIFITRGHVVMYFEQFFCNL